MEKIEPEIFQKALRSASELKQLLENSRPTPRNIQAHPVVEKNLYSIQEEQFIAFLTQPKILDYLRHDERIYDMFMESQYAPVRVEGPNKKMFLQ